MTLEKCDIIPRLFLNLQVENDTLDMDGQVNSKREDNYADSREEPLKSVLLLEILNILGFVIGVTKSCDLRLPFFRPGRSTRKVLSSLLMKKL